MDYSIILFDNRKVEWYCDYSWWDFTSQNLVIFIQMVITFAQNLKRDWKAQVCEQLIVISEREVLPISVYASAKLDFPS